MPTLYLASAILFEIIGTITMKWSANNPTSWAIALIGVSYCLSFILLWLSLKSLPLSLAYATWSGVGIAATAVAGVFLFHEKIDLAGFIGIGFIIIGILLLNVVSQTSSS